jgi:hypothetical protein
MSVDRRKLAKLIALASSPNAAEAAVAMRKAAALLDGAALRISDVVVLSNTAAVDYAFAAADLEAANAALAAVDLRFMDLATRVAEGPWPSRGGFSGTGSGTGNGTGGGAGRPAGAGSGGAFDFMSWLRENEPRIYAKVQAEAEAGRRRQAELRDRELASLLAHYGSVTAIIARNDPEERLHRAALPWLTHPIPGRSGLYPTGRWHARMGGWDLHRGEPCQECVAAIREAIPLPRTVTEARDELEQWEARNRELFIALNAARPGVHLDLPAACRRELVRRLFEYELPARTLGEMLMRSRGTRRSGSSASDEVTAPYAAGRG